MSLRKIIFFITAWVLILALIITIVILSNKWEKVTAIPGDIKIWITSGTTEWYDSLIEGFKEYAPEFKDTTITFEKKTTDPIRYRILLLSTMAEWTGPDIFMVGAGTDDVLQSKIEPIPSDVIDFSDFEKRYDDIFLPLIVSSGAKDTYKKYLYWVPLWFETMGIFYNKNLVRDVPKTWNDLDILYTNGIDTNVLVSNLWVGPRYTPNASDIIGLFLWKSGIQDVLEIKWTGERELQNYLNYKDIAIPRTNDDIYSSIISLSGKRESMDRDKETTLDMFMRGDIAMILGYPSLITELEKSDKRVGNESRSSLILTEKIPLPGPTEARKNIAKYDFFAISKTAKEPYSSVRFLEYLMTRDAEKRFLQNNDTLISAQREFWKAQENTSISDILNRTQMKSFIPDIDEELFVFSYWLKAEFDSFLSDKIDRNDNIDISNIWDSLSQYISCTIDIFNGKDVSSECEKR